MATTTAYPIGSAPPVGEVPPRMYAQVVRQDRFGEPTRRVPDRGASPPDDRPGRGAGLRDGRRHQLQQRLGRARHPDRRHRARQKRRRPERLPRRRQRRLRASSTRSARTSTTSRSATRSCSTAAGGTATTRGSSRARTRCSRRASRIWGYETELRQLRAVHARPGAPVPAEADAPDLGGGGGATLVGATAYRMLIGWPPHTVQRGDVVLVWGGSGGLGSRRSRS